MDLGRESNKARESEGEAIAREQESSAARETVKRSRRACGGLEGSQGSVEVATRGTSHASKPERSERASEREVLPDHSLSPAESDVATPTTLFLTVFYCCLDAQAAKLLRRGPR
eukprot:6193626-Pleurochrysis_carterae.AAC.1